MLSNLPPGMMRFLEQLAGLCRRSFSRLKRMCRQNTRLTRRRNYDAVRRSPAEIALRWALLLILVSTFLISTGKLIAYFGDYVSSRHSSAALRETCHMQEEPATETPLPTGTPPPDPATLEPAALPAAATAVPPTATPTAAGVLPTVQYPYNPYGMISERFKKIRRQNSGIIGWLTIPDLLDEAVVQRDNQYYLNRDYRGYHNANGAIFLEERSSLSTRPYTLILYGHNRKTGAMFGCLRNDENTSFYHNNPFISFDTIYEDGRYVIFSVAAVSMMPDDWDCLNLAGLISSFTADRQAVLKQLRALSDYSSTIDVQVDDQLLLLVTCSGDESERRGITARRIRVGEDEEALARLVRRSARK